MRVWESVGRRNIERFAGHALRRNRGDRTYRRHDDLGGVASGPRRAQGRQPALTIGGSAHRLPMRPLGAEVQHHLRHGGCPDNLQEVLPPAPPRADVEDVLLPAERVGVRDDLAFVLRGEDRDRQQAQRS